MSRFTDPQFRLQFDRLKQKRSIAQNRQEFWWLVARVQELNPKRILEIGTERGGTLFFWQQIVGEEGLVVSVDLCLVERRVEYPDLPQPIFIKGDSHDRETVLKVGEFAPFDFVFIDADHSHEGVVQDHDNYRPMIRPRGLMGFHDTGKHGAVEDTFKKLPGNKRTIYHTIGIGVIQL